MAPGKSDQSGVLKVEPADGETGTPQGPPCFSKAVDTLAPYANLICPDPNLTTI